uniref:Uncharacterized protein n=1 Tax=Aegilops tauschii subsp. strangulata TaxID=200361 RepID=A0A452XIK2_AEGTS
MNVILNPQMVYLRLNAMIRFGNNCLSLSVCLPIILLYDEHYLNFETSARHLRQHLTKFHLLD